MKTFSPREIWAHDDGKIREFGKAGFVVLAILGALAARRALAAHPLVLGLTGSRLPIVWQAARLYWLSGWALLTFAGAFPWFTRPLYVAMTVVGMSIGAVLGHAVLALTFFTLFVAIGRLRRTSSPVEMGFDRAAPTYWKTHEQVSDPKRYYRQY